MKDKFDESILQSFSEVSPYLSSLLDEDVSFALTDREKFIDFLPGENIRPDITVGKAIKEGSSTQEALKTKKTICKIVPEQVFGFKLKSIAVPLKGSNGEIAGVVSIGKSLKRQEEILNLSKNLSMALNQISSASSEVSSGVQNIAASNDVVLKEANEAFEKTKNTNEILSFIKNIEKQTNLLGLNASIEAARAGELGKGFSVVASEIRKLSNSSNESITKINQVIKEIQASVGNILNSIKEVNETSHNQAAALEELTASIQELNTTAESLKEISSNY
ncbi:putative sensory transducer protein YfmS [Clostridium liquoris]|uniref:Putative sensory transducer protein YfmS n=1 Tax=Clostridium liquoris TaxID=1289519 RepID=A0A2T0B034_9CLOT|nr:methyl-accepting chemotaxis protein [Clostridium liquoris]PRR76877.1 putative sensory transducer protein YfmS [Clostridium liquoris]